MERLTVFELKEHQRRMEEEEEAARQLALEEERQRQKEREERERQEAEAAREREERRSATEELRQSTGKADEITDNSFDTGIFESRSSLLFVF